MRCRVADPFCARWALGRPATGDRWRRDACPHPLVSTRGATGGATAAARDDVASRHRCSGPRVSTAHCSRLHARLAYVYVCRARWVRSRRPVLSADLASSSPRGPAGPHFAIGGRVEVVLRCPDTSSLVCCFAGASRHPSLGCSFAACRSARNVIGRHRPPERLGAR
jgi:hypothetical protein